VVAWGEGSAFAAKIHTVRDGEVHLKLTIEVGSEPISGSVSLGSGQPQPFRGWIELVERVEAARSADSSAGDPGASEARGMGAPVDPGQGTPADPGQGTPEDPGEDRAETLGWAPGAKADSL
jgi:hypothetical protein